MVALTPTQRLSEEQRQMFSQLQLPKSNCFHFCRPRQDGRGKSRHACVALQTSAPSGHAERTRPAPASATLLSASAPLRYTPAAPARRLHAGLRFRIPSTRASVRRGVCWGHAAACPQCSCMSAGHPIGGPARGGRGCWPAGCDSQIAKRENGCSSATRCATPANHGRSEELAARGRQGVRPGTAILVPRAGAWRKRHAPARGLSPWRRATPGIAILVFAGRHGGWFDLRAPQAAAAQRRRRWPLRAGCRARPLRGCRQRGEIEPTPWRPHSESLAVSGRARQPARSGRRLPVGRWAAARVFFVARGGEWCVASRGPQPTRERGLSDSEGL